MVLCAGMFAVAPAFAQPASGVAPPLLPAGPAAVDMGSVPGAGADIVAVVNGDVVSRADGDNRVKL